MTTPDLVIQPQSATLWGALLHAVRVRGARFGVIQDVQNPKPITYGKLITRARILAGVFQSLGLSCAAHADDPPVGVMLPGGAPLITTFFALQSMGRTTAMMNFNAGAAAFMASCAMARVGVIVTSHLFVERAGLTLLIDEAKAAGIQFLYIEEALADLRGKVAVRAFFRAKFAAVDAPVPHAAPHHPAVILFTSGSEGLPKGVVLSHANIQSNIAQFAAHLDIFAKDVMFACLPMYHSFGLTVGALLPLLGGMRVFFYPTPLHYHEIPGLIRQAQASILLSTDTFLGGYARCAGDKDFASLRLIVAGAEKLKPATRKTYRSRFGVELLEGYGVTETSPVISVNKPQANSCDTVGTLLPGITARIEPVPGLDEGGVLCVQGPNVMMGYLLAHEPGVIQPPTDGWHNTGDIVSFDADGYLSILGRAKRFAKIGGEMISLARVEGALDSIYPDGRHAVISVPHKTKGEALVLVTDCPDVDIAALRHAFLADGYSDLSVPRRIVTTHALPLLGSGKLDYARLQHMAEGQDSDPLALIVQTA